MPAGDAKVAEPNARRARRDEDVLSAHTTASVAPSPVRPSIAAVYCKSSTAPKSVGLSASQSRGQWGGLCHSGLRARGGVRRRSWRQSANLERT